MDQYNFAAGGWENEWKLKTETTNTIGNRGKIFSWALKQQLRFNELWAPLPEKGVPGHFCSLLKTYFWRLAGSPEQHGMRHMRTAFLLSKQASTSTPSDPARYQYFHAEMEETGILWGKNPQRRNIPICILKPAISVNIKIHFRVKTSMLFHHYTHLEGPSDLPTLIKYYYALLEQ